MCIMFSVFSIANHIKTLFLHFLLLHASQCIVTIDRKLHLKDSQEANCVCVCVRERASVDISICVN